MTTSSAQRLAIELHKELTASKAGSFMVIEVSPMTITTVENRMQNIVSIDLATLAPSVRFAKRQNAYMPNESVKELGDKIDEAGGKMTRNNSLIVRPNTQLIALCVMWVKRIMFDTSCAGTATHQNMIGQRCLSTFLNTSLLSIGVN